MSSEPCGGLVFGIPLSQCISNEQTARRTRGMSPSHRHGSDDADLHKKSHHGSRTSFGSLLDTLRNDKVSLFFTDNETNCSLVEPQVEIEHSFFVEPVMYHHAVFCGLISILRKNRQILY